MNKKLLKGALALFASIFMAVSCSAGDKTGGGGSTGGDTGTGGTQKTEINKNALKDAIKALTFTAATRDAEAIVFTGADISNGEVALSITGTTSITFTKIKGTKSPAKGLFATFAQLSSLEGTVTTTDLESKQKPNTKEVLEVDVKITPNSTHKFAADVAEGTGLTIGEDGSITIKFKFTPEQNWA